MTLKSQPHCGACSLEFDTLDALMSHMDNCEARKALLLPVTMLMLGARDASHRASHLVQALPGARALIEQYAEAVVFEDVSSWDRSSIHKRLCEKLGVDYSEFRPFESDEIVKIPSRSQAIDIIYRAVGVQLKSILLKETK